MFSLINITIGNRNDATTEPRDTYPEDKSTITKNPRLIETSTGERDISIPNAVLIPFPPLKFVNTENVCPRTAETPAIIFKTVISSNGV